MKYTKDEIVTALTNLGKQLGFGVNVPKANTTDGTEGDQPEGAAITVQFVTQNEETENPLAKLVEEFGGIEKVREALTAAIEYKAKANADAEDEKAKRNALMKKLAAGMDMDEKELEAMSTSAMEKLAAKMMRGNVQMNFAGLAGAAPVKTNTEQKPAPRPSVLLRPPAQATQ